jgi:hypothetical protein
VEPECRRQIESEVGDLVIALNNPAQLDNVKRQAAAEMFHKFSEACAHAVESHEPFLAGITGLLD